MAIEKINPSVAFNANHTYTFLHFNPELLNVDTLKLMLNENI